MHHLSIPKNTTGDLLADGQSTNREIFGEEFIPQPAGSMGIAKADGRFI